MRRYYKFVKHGFHAKSRERSLSRRWRLRILRGDGREGSNAAAGKMILQRLRACAVCTMI